MDLKLNAKDIQLHLLRIFHVSTERSYMFMQRHPIFSCVSLIFLILYIFLSYIYSFLVYMSPFLICGAIFLRIFWSSEKTELKYVKIEEKKEEQQKKVEPKIPPPKIPDKNVFVGRNEILYKFPSQNATSRRRNFRERKWDVYGGLEEKAKDLSQVFQNEFTNKRNMNAPFRKGESSVYYGMSTSGRKIKRQTLLSEPSMVDLVECVDTELEIEKMEDDEDEEDSKDDVKNAIEWTENDQKNLMDLGNSEMERNKRLESLIARRRARKLLKMQAEKGLIDKKSMPPLVISRENCDDDDDLEDMPGSAPSVMPRSPYDIPYEPFEEKPNLRGDASLQELEGHHYHQKNVTFSNHQSFKHEYGSRDGFSFPGKKFSDKLSYSRFKRLPDQGNHDWLIDQLIYNEGNEIGIQEPKPLGNGEEITHEKDEKCKTDIEDLKDDKVENDHTKSISDIETSSVLQKPRSRKAIRFSKSQERLNFSLNKTTEATNINESTYDNVPSPINKRKETMFLNDQRLCHTPTYSIASDLQVEVSEVGSPTSTVDENGETNSSSERDSMLYDGDIDRDVSSGSEDLWGASFHGKGGARNEEDHNHEDVHNNSKEIVSPTSLKQIDEEEVADVSSYSSRDEGPDDTPTCRIVETDHNVFGDYVKYSRGKYEIPQSSHPFHELDQYQFIGSSSMNQSANENNQEKQQEGSKMSENLINHSHVINDANNSTIIEQSNTENSTSSEDPGSSTQAIRQESLDEGSNESISSSPRSVLDKTVADGNWSPSFNQQMDVSYQQSSMDDMTQETLNEDEHPHDTMPQNIQSLVDDINDESHNDDINHSQEHTNNIENSIEESNIFSNMNDEENMMKEQQDKSNSSESSEENSTHQISQEETSESTKPINEI